MTKTRLELTLAQGSIEHVSTRALVLGAYRNVDPDGPATVVNRALGGMLRQTIARRMFSADAGSLFMLPAARSGLRTDFVLLAGLGPFDQFEPDVLQVVGGNVVRTLVGSNVDDFATVMIGAGSGLPPRECLRHLLTGFVSCFAELCRDGRLQRVTFCEIDRSRYRAMVRDASRVTRLLARKHDVEINVRLQTIAASPGSTTPAPGAKSKSTVYLLVRQDDRTESDLVLSSAVLTTGPHAAIATERMHVSQSALRAHLETLENREATPARLVSLGKSLARLALPATIRRQLEGLQGHHLAIVHDAAASRIPWEVLRLGSRTPALDAGMSRRYTAGNMAVARWAEPRQDTPDLRMLLVENPTGDLDGAAAESARIKSLVKRSGQLRVTVLQGRRATRAAVLDALRSEKFDVLHYAGHASFEDESPARSGLRCADGILAAAHLFELRALPALLFFNACESGRIGAARARRGTVQGLSGAVGFAETFLRAGVANYVGTYWPVADVSARRFSGTFYRSLLAGETVAVALLEARRAVRRLKSDDAIDWADYIHYGNPDFRVKIRG
jgi:CHAT domain-containing protein